MNIDIKPLLKKLQPFINFLKKDSVAIFLVIIAIIFGFLIWRIGSLAGAEPSESEVDEKLLTVVRPRLDKDSIDKIKALQAHNVDIQSYFVDRSNPFQE